MTGARPGREGEGAKWFRERLAEVEQRVRAVVADNRQLRVTLLELEQELDRARAELQELQVVKEKRAEVRGRLERILAEIESLKMQKGTDPAPQD